MNLTLRQLKIFEAVARHLSFTKASEELHLTQPAVSMQIKQLEQTTGVPLFELVGKRVYLTEAGQELQRYSRSITMLLAEAEQVFEEMKGLRRGRLNITVASTANYFVPRLWATFRKRHPDVSVSLDVTNREGLIRALAENQADLVIMGLPPEGLDLVAESFMPNPLVVIAPPSHPLAAAKQVPLQRLQGETFLVREQGSGTRSLMERVFAEKGLAPATPIEMSSTEAIKQGVEAGLGLALLSLHTLEMELALKRLVVLHVEGFPVLREWYIVHRSGKRLSAVAQAFRDFILTETKDIVHVPQV
ncbi:MAG: LysR substrate-binding domain-containing protein [Gammaproteobacteria bacterium]|jgi:DNA-binding transcriptional LysR family regulator|nr:LysR substrate-binding domain-containing protein [Gammaproteobacteria bacterium]